MTGVRNEELEDELEEGFGERYCDCQKLNRGKRTNLMVD